MLYFGTRACLFKGARSQDPTVQRMLSKLQDIGKAALPDKRQEVMSGSPRPAGTCSPPQGLTGGWWGTRAGARLAGQGQSILWGGRKQRLVGRCLNHSGASPWLRFAGHSMVEVTLRGLLALHRLYVYLNHYNQPMVIHRGRTCASPHSHMSSPGVAEMGTRSLVLSPSHPSPNSGPGPTSGIGRILTLYLSKGTSHQLLEAPGGVLFLLLWTHPPPPEWWRPGAEGEGWQLSSLEQNPVTWDRSLTTLC